MNEDDKAEEVVALILEHAPETAFAQDHSGMVSSPVLALWPSRPLALPALPPAADAEAAAERRAPAH